MGTESVASRMLGLRVWQRVPRSYLPNLPAAHGRFPLLVFSQKTILTCGPLACCKALSAGHGTNKQAFDCQLKPVRSIPFVSVPTQQMMHSLGTLLPKQSGACGLAQALQLPHQLPAGPLAACRCVSDGLLHPVHCCPAWRQVCRRIESSVHLVMHPALGTPPRQRLVYCAANTMGFARLQCMTDGHDV
jgi:hypothetical protein